MKYWSSTLILSHTDRQTPRLYPQKNSDSWLHSKCLFQAVELDQYSENPSIRTSVRACYERCPGMPAGHSVARSQGALFLLSSLCLTGFVAHFLGLIRTFCQFHHYWGLSKCAQNIHEQFQLNTSNFTLTTATQVNAIEVSIIGSLSSKTN